MKTISVLDYMLNKHIPYDELVERYNELLIKESELERKCRHLQIKYDLSKIVKEKVTDKNKDLQTKYNNILYMCNLFIQCNDIIKIHLNELLEQIDDTKDKLDDNNYLTCMNHLKVINDNLYFNI